MALKMKLKNMKAQNKKFKGESEEVLDQMEEESEQDTNGAIILERKPVSLGIAMPKLLLTFFFL